MREPHIPSRTQGRQHMPMRRRGDPFRMFQSDVDRVLDSFMRVFNTPMQNLPNAGSLLEASLGESSPRIDIRDRDKQIEILAELPGVNESDIDISVGDGMLTLTADMQSDENIEDRDFVVHERTFGRIQRAIPLPENLDLDQAKAHFKNGLLTIKIPKSAEAQSQRRIKVQSEEPSIHQVAGSSSSQDSAASSSNQSKSSSGLGGQESHTSPGTPGSR